MEIVDIEANGYTFTCRRCGGAGPGVILLHGFPETSHMWTPLLERLASSGYRALAPDQRGYSPGARPEGAENYDYRHLVGDVLALADCEGFETFHLVGHDHGAGVGWSLVFDHPERVSSWCALSVPH
ncbi:MAG: alpha/beta fold hydrolase, partial [Gammaproteobacteria bacterium]